MGSLRRQRAPNANELTTVSRSTTVFAALNALVEFLKYTNDVNKGVKPSKPIKKTNPIRLKGKRTTPIANAAAELTARSPARKELIQMSFSPHSSHAIVDMIAEKLKVTANILKPVSNPSFGPKLLLKTIGSNAKQTTGSTTPNNQSNFFCPFVICSLNCRFQNPVFGSGRSAGSSSKPRLFVNGSGTGAVSSGLGFVESIRLPTVYI